MLFPVAGSRFHIAAPGSFSLADPASGDWVEVGEVESLGAPGVSWETVEVTHLGSDGQEFMKGRQLRNAMQLIFGADPADAGQTMLWTAAGSRESYGFRLVFPGAAAARTWAALVIGLGEVLDSANNVIGLQADLQPTSATIRE